MQEDPLGQTYCSGLTRVPKPSLSTGIGCFRSCSLLRSQIEVEVAFLPVFTDLHREKIEVPTSTKLFLRLKPTRPQEHSEVGRRRVHYSDDPHQGSSKCKQSLVPETEEEDAA